MYGWRGPIGHVYPAAVAETYCSDFFRVVPEGVTLVMTISRSRRFETKIFKNPKRSSTKRSAIWLSAR